MVKMRFEGGTEIAKALATLASAVSKRILVRALAEGAEPIRQSMAAHAPRSDEAPHIADHIVISVARTEDQAAVAIGPAKGFAYGVPLEVGTVDTPAQPFARPAFDGNTERAQRIVGAAIWRELAGKGVSRSGSQAGSVAAPDGGDLL
jgi:HK97 gp10 family phage protein